MLKLVGEIINNPHCREESGCINCRGDNKQSTLYRRKWMHKLVGEIINSPLQV
jgi:hypothetical protein